MSQFNHPIDKSAHQRRLREHLELMTVPGPSLLGERRQQHHPRLEVSVDRRGAYRVRQPGSSRWLCID